MCNEYEIAGRERVEKDISPIFLFICVKIVSVGNGT